jgi:hypothetical protein
MEGRDLAGKGVAELLAETLGPLRQRRARDVVQAPDLVVRQVPRELQGRAGGGEELGGRMGLELYMQRTALQGFKSVVEKYA